MEPDWDKMLNLQDKYLKQQEAQFIEANKRVDALKKPADYASQENYHEQHQVYHTGELDAKHSCYCAIL